MHIEEFARRLRARETTVEQATNEAVQRAEAEQSRLNAFIRIMHAEAHQQARELDQELASGRDRGPLHGIPVTIKDILDIKGVATTAASKWPISSGSSVACACTTLADEPVSAWPSQKAFRTRSSPARIS